MPNQYGFVRLRFCKCGCGQLAKRWHDKDGRFKAWMEYADGHYRLETPDRPNKYKGHEKEYYRKYRREWIAKASDETKAKIAERSVEYRKRPEIKEKIRAWGRKSHKKYTARPEIRRASLERHREYRLKFPGRHRLSEQRRRILKTANGGTCSHEQWIQRCEYFGWHCVYCGEALNRITASVDHVIPVSRGGSGWPSNLVPSCIRCNMVKHTDKWTPKRWGTTSVGKVG